MQCWLADPNRPIRAKLLVVVEQLCNLLGYAYDPLFKVGAIGRGKRTKEIEIKKYGQNMHVGLSSLCPKCFGLKM